jgi:chemotaxis protein histidine kinase CheA
MDDLTREFLQESTENLDRLDQDFVKWEREPSNLALVESVFRASHTIRGTCGFLGFAQLESAAPWAKTCSAGCARVGENVRRAEGTDCQVQVLSA